MSELDPTLSVRPPKSKWRFWVCSGLLMLAVLQLGAIGLWKSNNFVTVKMLDYFVCTGTLDDEPLLAELNFQTDKEVTALIAFADGRHWSLANHRVENEQHVWDLLDPDNNIDGTLRGEWDAAAGSFNGQLVRSSGDSKASRVTLKQVAQFEHTVRVSGLRIGAFGEVSISDSLNPKFPLDSPLGRAVEEELLITSIFEQSIWTQISSRVKTLVTSRSQPDGVSEYVRHLLAVREQSFSAKDSYRIVSGMGHFMSGRGWWHSIHSVVVEDGQLRLISWERELQEEFSSIEGQQPLWELIEARPYAELMQQRSGELDALGLLNWTMELRRGLKVSFEQAGMRVNLPPDAGDPEYEFVIPWSEVRRFFRDDSRVLDFMPTR